MRKRVPNAVSRIVGIDVVADEGNEHEVGLGELHKVSQDIEIDVEIGELEAREEGEEVIRKGTDEKSHDDIVSNESPYVG